MSKPKKKSCYFCGGPATSDEHVPPKAFFPEDGALPNARSLRVNLITVPSCDLHNSRKSGDDEAFFAVIAGSIGVNHHAIGITRRKVLSAIRGKPKKLQAFYRDLQPAVFNKVPTGIFTVDKDRFDRWVVAQARALYFHQYRQRWVSDMQVVAGMMIPNSPQLAGPYNVEVIELFKLGTGYLNETPWRGTNQEIFRYKIRRNVPAVELWLLMDYYEGFPVLVISAPLQQGWVSRVN
jgi:hypothetical protein